MVIRQSHLVVLLTIIIGLSGCSDGEKPSGVQRENQTAERLPRK